MEKTKAPGTRPVLVQIATPYLALAPQEFADSPLDLMRQIVMAGYQPDNLADTEALQTRRHAVLLRKHPIVDLQLPHLPDFVIQGMNERGEADIRALKGTGVIVARYSIFHGSPSGYTGSTCADAGYALDIPKDAGLVKRLLTFDPFLSALVKREENKLKNAVDRFNRHEKLEQKVLVTPYLSEALRIPKAR